MTTFYHASTIGNLCELLPLSNLHGSDEKVCYFTPVRAYALFYLRDMEVNHVTCSVSDNGIVVYHEQFPNQIEIIYQGRVGYIYACKENNHIKLLHTNGVWGANQPIKINENEVEYIEDAYIEMMKAEKNGEIQINRYDLLSVEKKEEITQMMKKLILKNNYISIETPKARFFRKNFPDAYREACNEIIK